jgi:hypothetical protein
VRQCPRRVTEEEEGVESNPELRLEDARSIREGLWRMAQLSQDAVDGPPRIRLLGITVSGGPSEGPPDREPDQHAGAEQTDDGPTEQEDGHHPHHETSERSSARLPLPAGGYGDASLPEEHHTQHVPTDQAESAGERVGRRTDLEENSEPHQEAPPALEPQQSARDQRHQCFSAAYAGASDAHLENSLQRIAGFRGPDLPKV